MYQFRVISDSPAELNTYVESFWRNPLTAPLLAEGWRILNRTFDTFDALALPPGLLAQDEFLGDRPPVLDELPE